MIALRLPWPPSTLSPNRRQHWARLAKAKHHYRETCLVETRLQVGVASRMANRLALDLEFRPPNRRSYDRDNLLARMKSGLDGCCDALGIDDSRFASVTIRGGEPVPGGYVVVRIGEDRP